MIECKYVSLCDIYYYNGLPPENPISEFTIVCNIQLLGACVYITFFDVCHEIPLLKPPYNNNEIY